VGPLTQWSTCLPTAKLLFLRESPKQNQTKDDKNRAQQQTAEWRAHRNLLFLLRFVLQNSMLGIKNKSIYFVLHSIFIIFAKNMHKT
jgi:hypothetical protein